MKKIILSISFLLATSSFAASKCLNELSTYCPHNVAQANCLQENESKFSSQCLPMVRELKQGHVAVIRQDEPCDADYARLCSSSPLKAADCMKSHFDELKPSCQQVGHVMVGMELVRFNRKERPKEPCDDDFARFCNGDPSKDVLNCMKSHLKELSPRCQTAGQVQTENHVYRFASKAENQTEVCEKELKAICKGKKSDTCLQESLPILSSPCREMFGKMVDSFQVITKAQKSCPAEVRNFCPDSSDTLQKRAECYRANMDKLSPDCKAAGMYTEPQ